MEDYLLRIKLDGFMVIHGPRGNWSRETMQQWLVDNLFLYLQRAENKFPKRAQHSRKEPFIAPGPGPMAAQRKPEVRGAKEGTPPDSH